MMLALDPGLPSPGFGPARTKAPRRCAAILVMFAIAMCIAAAVGSVAAQSPEQRETPVEGSIKAAFLFKFLGYVEWPDATPENAASLPMVVGVVGAEDLESALAEIALGKTVNGRPFTVRQLALNDALDGVHALYIGRSQQARSKELLKKAQQEAILTVTDFDDGLAQGSIINFKTLDGRIRFDVSLGAARKSGLRISSRMLSVAHTVQKGPE